MAIKTAYRWNANRWFFTTREVEEDPDFPGEYNLPSRSTWDEPPADTETQWPRRDTELNEWILEDLDMDGRLAEGLITQAEYDEWKARQEDEFLSILKERANLNAGNIALVSDVEAEAETRAAADSELQNKDVELESGIANIQANLATLSASLAENSKTDEDTKIALQAAIAALQSTVSTLQTAVNNKADAGHSHSVVDAAHKLYTARNIGNAAFDGSGNISLEQMGVSALIASTVANTGNITVEESGNATNRQLIIRDTKNKIGFLFASYHGSGYAGAYGPDTPSDFDTIYHVIGSADATDTKVVIDPDINSAYIYSGSNFKNASMVFIARLK